MIVNLCPTCSKISTCPAWIKILQLDEERNRKRVSLIEPSLMTIVYDCPGYPSGCPVGMEGVLRCQIKR